MFFLVLHLLISKRNGGRNAENTLENTNFIPGKYILDCIKSPVLPGFSAQICRHPKVSNSVAHVCEKYLVFSWLELTAELSPLLYALCDTDLQIFVTALLNILFF